MSKDLPDDRLFQENENTAPTADERLYCECGPLALASGITLPEATVAYETWGTLAPAKDNAILVCHALSGDSHATGWWDRIVGPGKAIDTDKFFVVGQNVIGGCQGSTGPQSINPETNRPYGKDFPAITVADMVDAQAKLADDLGISQWLCVAGGSMGGMQALEWACRYPHRTTSVWMTASCAAHTAMQIGFNEVGRQAILRDPDFQSHGTSHHGLSVARMVGHLSYLSDYSFTAKFGRKLQDPHDPRSSPDHKFQVESYLSYQGDKFVNRFDPVSYIALTRAIDDYEADLTQIKDTEFLLTAFTSDWIYPVHLSESLHTTLEALGKASQLHILPSPLGHDAFLLDDGPQAECAQNFVSSIRQNFDVDEVFDNWN